MIFDCEQLARVCQIWDKEFSTPVQLRNGGLWIGVLSSGQCALSGTEGCTASAGSLLVGPGPLRLEPLSPCHIMALRMEGAAPQMFLDGLSAPMFACGISGPDAAQLVAMLASGQSAERACGLCCQLLCELANADSAAPVYSPLVAQAITAMREHYAGLYGVEELSESLGVSKSHLVRAFKSQVGITPGQYLTNVRIDAAKQLLCHREYSLDVVASLCGFSGANYLCRVFKQRTGMTPAAFRADASGMVSPMPPMPLENEMYV